MSKDFEVYISKEKIEARVKELAAQIDKDYSGEEVTIIGILNGSFIFCADLVREITLPLTFDFVAASSYGASTTSSGVVKILMDSARSIEGKHCLIVEDIVDTGNTLSKLMEIFRARNPKSIKLVSLLSKPSRLVHKVDIDYMGFEIEDKFVIGYGLDFDGKYRELPYIGIYDEKNC
jgi:hypoxanthine phosphoribosyltransferase